MEEPGPGVLFLGDLDDPWVAEIADALPEGAGRVGRDGRWPGSWPRGFEAARVVVVHRPILAPGDGEAFLALKARPGPPTRLVLCVGPHVRAADLERWAGPADVILPEATASETVARHVAARPRPAFVRPRVAVVGGTFEARRVLADACEAAGYRASSARDWDEAPREGLAIWDVPVLEPGWERTLEAEARRREVVCLIGFADRDLVARARLRGAAACLDSTSDPADLAFVLDRVAAGRPITIPIASAHAVPPPPKGLRVVPRPVADPRPDP